MADTQYTPGQRRAIEHPRLGGRALVSAAAGSGKTEVLTERAVRLIADPADPLPANRLFLVTFTRAAAAELRARIRQKLLLRLAEAAPGSQQAQWLRRQPSLLQRAEIGTIDSFCLHFLQQNYSQLDTKARFGIPFPGDFSIADEVAAERLRSEALAETLEASFADPAFCAFAEIYGRSRSTDGAAGAILQLFRFVSAAPEPQAELRRFLTAWSEPGEKGEALSPADTVWGQELLQAARLCSASLRSLLDAALAPVLAEEHAPAGKGKDKNLYQKYFAKFDKARIQLDALDRALAADDWDAAYAASREFSITADSSSSLAAKAGQDRLVSELFSRFKVMAGDLSSACFVCTAAEFRQDFLLGLQVKLADGSALSGRPAAEMGEALLRAAALFEETFLKAKLAEGLLEHSDCEHFTLELLRAPDGGRTPLGEATAAGIGAIMVDEYQDTNALQDEIYRLLAAPGGENLFFVGDPKQSIYRFRQAEVSLYSEKLTAWQQEGGGAVITMGENFRSTPGVLTACNALFERLFSPELGGVAYDGTQALRYPAALPESGTPAFGGAELLVELGASEITDAETVAGRIAAMMQEGAPVRVKGSGETRPCAYEDFCILLSVRRSFAAYQQALEARGIPVYADTERDLLAAPHILPLVSLLRLIDNPSLDVDFSAVLLSPLLPGFSPDDLVALRLESPRGPLYSAAAALAAREAEDEGHWRLLMGSLRAWTRLAASLPMDAFLEELLSATGYLGAVGVMAPGGDAREDVLDFTAWCAGAGKTGLHALVRALDTASRRAGGLHLAQDASAKTLPGHVTILTVHRSKGLEFPFVFVADTAHRFNRADLTEPVTCHRSLGLGFRLRVPGTVSLYPTLMSAALASRVGRELAGEQLRVLYVALTRARDRLFITVPVRRVEKSGSHVEEDPVQAGFRRLAQLPALLAASGCLTPGSLSALPNWASWLLAACLCLEEGQPLWARVEGALPPAGPPPGTGGALTVRLLPPPRADALASETPCPAAAPEEGEAAAQRAAAFAEELRARFAWSAPEAKELSIPIKLSVSDIARGPKPSPAPETALLRRPQLLQGGLSAAEHGTLLHAFLQNLPLSQGKPDFKAELRRQKEAWLLDPTLADSLLRDEAAVEAFFASPAWQRIVLAAEQGRRAGREGVLREANFITAIPAREIPFLETDSAHAVLMQGAADLVLVFDDHLEIIDYKTDASREPRHYTEAYTAQLQLYARAFNARFRQEGLAVTRLTVFAFSLGRELSIPLAPDEAGCLSGPPPV